MNFAKRQIDRIGKYAKTTKALIPIQNYLREIGFATAIRAFLDLRNPTDDMTSMDKLIKENSDAIKKVSDMLYDEKSKRVYNGIIDYRHTRNVKSMKPIMLEKDLYFVKGIISLSDEEVFVDGGAYDGDTTLEFAKRTQGKYKEIIAFEPSHENFLNLSDTVKREYITNATMYEEGLWSEKTTLTFVDDSSMAAHVDGLGSELAEAMFETTSKVKIKVNSIDNAAFDKAPTFIKMDIEGAELEALIGAQKTIRQYKPKLAISLYHKTSDFIDIPLYIKGIVPEYKIYIRQHSHYLHETVLYAVI